MSFANSEALGLVAEVQFDGVVARDARRWTLTFRCDDPIAEGFLTASEPELVALRTLIDRALSSVSRLEVKRTR